MDIEHLGILLVVAVVAGFVDAIAGGGGLLTVPALALSGLDPVSALATNKLQSAFGSGAATLISCADADHGLRLSVKRQNRSPPPQGAPAARD